MSELFSKFKNGRPEWIFFDLDGTLTDPFTGITESVRYALDKMGIAPPAGTELKSFIGPPLDDSFRERFSMTQREAEQAIAFYRERFSTVGLFENEVYPDIPALLTALRQSGYRLAVATSKPTCFSSRILERFQLTPYFEVLTGSELDGSLVRKGDVIRKALADCGCKAENALMVGDRCFDIKGAHENGLVAVGVLYGYGNRAEFEAAGAEAMAKTVPELAELLGVSLG